MKRAQLCQITLNEVQKSFIHSQALIVQGGPLAFLFRVSWSHTYKHTVGLLWTSDQPVAEASTYTGQHRRQTNMPSAGFEPAIPATKRPQTYALDRASIEAGYIHICVCVCVRARARYKNRRSGIANVSCYWKSCFLYFLSLVLVCARQRMLTQFLWLYNKLKSIKCSRVKFYLREKLHNLQITNDKLRRREACLLIPQHSHNSKMPTRNLCRFVYTFQSEQIVKNRSKSGRKFQI
jgi:hypothetical protein